MEQLLKITSSLNDLVVKSRCGDIVLSIKHYAEGMNAYLNKTDTYLLCEILASSLTQRPLKEVNSEFEFSRVAAGDIVQLAGGELAKIVRIEEDFDDGFSFSIKGIKGFLVKEGKLTYPLYWNNQGRYSKEPCHLDIALITLSSK